ncbi:TetR/AcrR family transcriptional regulator [Ruminiclostridium papyrosolvens DSM 2782]|uniref:TetR/AcrR family transcriptional regulator n=1 Tax=Ruminiclostridium papyrosolvens DSM 2782 TaxID=588581 RepID=F1TAE9_9FIRM|nr:TetR-like C-terminal domain-containing protein [Ruminiclostridium papyrosolvens]EGD48492.1 TetR/AcrR family transcriptional regulator [Ruminiclostridium papyrosolvens DSM 2782]WES32750.1 TetR-like C-terminal domain-containing protein [Ruminiclostridium papyrosolvens DSM 2782]
MKIEKIDRRVKYTNLLLKESIIELLKTKHISKVSVKMLCNTADINRSTFYAHYADQYDLLEKLEQEVMTNLKEYINHVKNEPSQVLNQVLEYAAKDAELFKVLLSENCGSAFQRDFMSLSQQKIISKVKDDHSIDVRTSEYLQCFILSGALEIFKKWLHDGMVESPEQMAELISKLLFQGTSFFYKKRNKETK